MIYSTTHEFTHGQRIRGDLTRKINLANYTDVCKKSLKDIRKETEELLKKKRRERDKSKKVVETMTPKAPENIVENAIGKSSNEILAGLDKLTPKSTKKGKTEKDDFVFPIKETISKEVVQESPKIESKKESEESTETMATKLAQFANTDVFDKELEKESAETKSEESEGIDIVEYLHKIDNLDGIQFCVDLFIQYDFFLSHTENNGAALFSEVIVAMDRVTNNKYNFLDYVCANYEVYVESVNAISRLCAENFTSNEEVHSIMKALIKCTR